jgi:hypothetical protein
MRIVMRDIYTEAVYLERMDEPLLSGAETILNEIARVGPSCSEEGQRLLARLGAALIACEQKLAHDERLLDKLRASPGWRRVLLWLVG